ncbi:NADH dehydrogenase 1 alpha subcomplex subunit 12 [Acrasis kona]|uniref:NADH dehydrogenase [ubiquinone] 1 alpha subcomplex subunit 12 n=1 Tax=Acrasis kona TaxID=1008807 RepID=A0AAW2ZE94_9EUKA
MSFYNKNLLNMVNGYFIKKMNIIKDVKQYGLRDMLKKWFVMREAWWDKKDKVYVGTDRYGNVYWETQSPEVIGRHRWVQYTKRKGNYYEDSDVPPAWNLWLQSQRADPPTEAEQNGTTLPCLQLEHAPNRTLDPLTRNLPLGHFLSPKHKNWDEYQNVYARPFDINNLEDDSPIFKTQAGQIGKPQEPMLQPKTGMQNS